MAQLTVKQLEALTAGDAGRRLPDGESMWGEVRATRNPRVPVSVDFQWRFKLNGKARTLRVGNWPKLSLKSLRDARDRLAAEVKSGIDPVERKATERLRQQADAAQAKQDELARLAMLADRQARLSVRSLFDLWVTLELRQRQDLGAEARRSFEKDVFPVIGDMAAADVKKVHIQTIIDSMMMRGVVRMTKRVLSDLRQMFGFALDRDLIEADPTTRIKKAKIGPDNERDRVLSEKELIALFDKLPSAGLAETSKLAILLQLSTITRIGEVLSARWEHVDFERRQWLLPTTKNGKPHQVWLSDFALVQLEKLHRFTGDTAWLFPNTKKQGSVDPKTITKQVADRQRAKSPMSGRTQQVDSLSLPGGQWRPHDLRRTGASMMAELGAIPEVIERCMNHTEENKMKRIYQRASYESQMQDAWRTLGQRLELLRDGHRNVVLLKVAA